MRIGVLVKVQNFLVKRKCFNVLFVFSLRLRHVSKGYWLMVQEFTHKEDARMILSLTNITTDIDRGTYLSNFNI